MNQLARNEIYFQRQVSPEEIADGIDSVNEEQIRHLAAEIFTPEATAITAIGPVKEEEVLEFTGQKQGNS